MSGPGGNVTNRDRRRESRREQYLQRQAQARKARQQQIRNQQIRQWSIIGAGALVLVLVLFLIIHAVTSGSGQTSSGTGQTAYWQHAASGQEVDGIKCQASEQLVYHYHAYLKIYVDGSQVEVPGGIGIPGQCIYWMHVHTGEPNFVHIESPNSNKYTVKQFFDIGGESLSGASFMGHPVDASHKLVAEVFDSSGKQVQTANGADTGNIVLADHETVVLLYNSPNVKATPNSDWSPVS